MSDSAVQSAPPTSIRSTPNFSTQTPAFKGEAADPALVKETGSSLTNHAADRAVAPDAQSSPSGVDTATSPRTSGASTALPAAQPAPPPEDRPKADDISARPIPVASERADRSAPDASVSASIAPVGSGLKPNQPVADPELPLAAGTGRAVPGGPATTPVMAAESDPSSAGTARNGLPAQPLASERPVAEASAARLSPAAARGSRTGPGPISDEPPPHPGLEGAKASGPERLAVEEPANTTPARQRRKTKSDPASDSAERPADPRAGQVTATIEVPTPAQTAASQRATKPEVTVSTVGTEKVHATPSPGSGEPAAAPATVAADANRKVVAAVVSSNLRTASGEVPVEPAIPQQVSVATREPSALGSIMSSRRQPALGMAPWKVPVPAIGARIAHHEQRVADDKTARLVSQAEKSGSAMEASLDRFMSGPARGIMNSLKTAAASDPGGMPAVITGMKPGGAYAAERTAFETAMKNPVVGADYTAMADSAQRHAKDRYAVENNLHQRGLDPAVLGERFTKKDAELGEKAASIPGREAGKNALEEMAQKLAELLRKAMERVGQAFGRTASADVQATARPSPSPSPSP